MMSQNMYELGNEGGEDGHVCVQQMLLKGSFSERRKNGIK